MTCSITGQEKGDHVSRFDCIKAKHENDCYESFCFKEICLLCKDALNVD
jgi:hypothetical protein